MSFVLLNNLLIVFIFSSALVKCEVFTALTDLENLVHTHENMISNIEQYIEKEENRLNVLKRYQKLFTDGHEKMSSDIHEYVDNPINAFILIKRLSTDFERLKTIASEPTDFVWDQEMLYPTEEDLTGAAVAIARLQYVYKLNTTHLAEGNLQGVSGSPMTASDCYNLAMMLYKQEDPDYDSRAAEWFEAALEKLNNEQNENTFTATEVMAYIVKSHHRASISLDPKAYIWAEKLQALKPNENTDSVMKLYKHALERNNVNSTETGLWNTYPALCRGESDVPAAKSSKLHCSYLRNIPFLKLAPIKMEEVHKNPNAFIFYDILSNDDIQIIKAIAGPMLERAKLSGGIFSEDRIGKSAWLHENITPVEKLRRRTADFTGLSLLFAEPLQVLNYGIGGHYNWHYDAFNTTDEEIGDRIATVLFYMSDVSQGGATVFANLKLTVTPKKGSALFWENLHPSGEIDRRTLHAACPVLYGRKWVSNIWIHEAGQELLRPCPVV